MALPREGTMAAHPAFIAVPARQNLVSKPATPPPEVTSYVQRAFQEFNKNKRALAMAGITDADFRAKLTAVVHECLQDGAMIYRDWASHKLPHQLIQDERAQAVLCLTQAQAQADTNPYNPSPVEAPVNHVYSSGPNVKKRKSPDADPAPADQDARAVTPPWKKKNHGSVNVGERGTGKSKNSEKKKKDFAGGMFDTSEAALDKRRQRFGLVTSGNSPTVSSRDDSPLTEGRNGPIVGTCPTLEKNYFRLTAPPNPNTVRPHSVLVEALKVIKQKWKRGNDYRYVCDQLKSMRQDLTVQRIKTPFTIEVYEVHARIALQMKDLGEYNQCQTQLRALYKLGLGGRDSRDEFLAYRILYIVYTCNRTDMNDMLADLTTADKQKPIVKHALQIRAALASGNYHRFFRLYGEAQGMQMVPYLMDMFIERERLAAMATICKAYKPDVSMGFLASELAFDVDEDDSGSAENVSARLCYDFVCRHNGGPIIARKDDSGEIRIKTGQAGPIFENARKGAFKVDIKGQI